MLDLIKAARTSRLFQETLGERERAAINRCLAAAEAKHGPDVLGNVGTFSSLVHVGLHPRTLQALERDEPDVFLTALDLVREADGGPKWTERRGDPPPGDANMSVYVGCLKTRFFVNVLCAGLEVEGGMNSESMCRWLGHERLAMVRANPGNLQEALGVFLAVMGVQKQRVVRPAGASLSTKVSPSWWLEAGALAFAITIPRAEISEFVDARGRMRTGARLKIWQRALQTQAATDALCVVAALRLKCTFFLHVEGDRHEGFFSMHPCDE